MQKNKIILVTGGAGFIGSSVVRQLNSEGYQNIVIVDHLRESDKWKNLVGKRFLDIIHSQECFPWLEKNKKNVSAVIHLGANSSTTERNAHYLLENNYRFTIHLAELSINNDIRFIYASSAATYGMGEQGFNDCHKTLGQLKPLNMYGYSKHLCDLWMEQKNLLDKVVGLKYFNVFGPNEAHKGSMASVLYHFFNDAREKKKVRLFASNSDDYKDGEQKRDFIYVKDAARLTCAFLHNQKVGLYNIASGIATTWNELAHALFDALDVKGTIEYFQMPQSLSKQYQNYTCADMQKLQSTLGLEAQVMPFKEAVKDYVQEHLLKGDYA